MPFRKVELSNLASMQYDKFLAHIYFVLKNPQAADRTIEILKEQADYLGYCRSERLRKLGISYYKHGRQGSYEVRCLAFFSVIYYAFLANKNMICDVCNPSIPIDVILPGKVYDEIVRKNFNKILREGDMYSYHNFQVRGLRLDF